MFFPVALNRLELNIVFVLSWGIFSFGREILRFQRETIHFKRLLLDNIISIKDTTEKQVLNRLGQNGMFLYRMEILFCRMG